MERHLSQSPARHAVPRPSLRIAAGAAATGFILLAAYQLALALGAPWGAAAWGGQHSGVLPTSLRFGSAVSVLIFVGAALVVLGRAGYWQPTHATGVFRHGPSVLVVIMGLSTMANLVSASVWERFLLGPVALLLTVLCVIVARGAPGDDYR